MRARGDLQKLDLRNTEVTDVGLEHLKGLTNLRGLDLSGCNIAGSLQLPNLRGTGAAGNARTSRCVMTDAGLKHLEGMSRLHQLDLIGCDVTDAGLTHLTGLISLKSLCLDDTKITDAGITNLKGLNSLQYLSLARMQLTDAVLMHFEGLSNLRFLDLEGTKASDAGAQHLRHAVPGIDISFERELNRYWGPYGGLPVAPTTEIESVLKPSN